MCRPGARCWDWLVDSLDQITAMIRNLSGNLKTSPYPDHINSFQPDGPLPFAPVTLPFSISGISKNIFPTKAQARYTGDHIPQFLLASDNKRVWQGIHCCTSHLTARVGATPDVYQPQLFLWLAAFAHCWPWVLRPQAITTCQTMVFHALRYFKALLMFSIIDAVEKRFFAKTSEKEFFFYFLQPTLRCFYFFHHLRDFH